MLEQMAPLGILAAFLTAGVRLQGRRFLLRYLWSAMIGSVLSFVLFQVSHYQMDTLDGDQFRDELDDWGAFQLHTSWGWAQMSRPAWGLNFLFLNLQPAHHVLPAIHHSKLHLVTPAIRAHYPVLMEDHALLPMIMDMFKILLGYA